MLAAVGVYLLAILIVVYQDRNKAVRFVTLKVTVLFYMFLLGVFGCFWIAHKKAKVYRSFQSKIEDYLCDLFPHSNNANYARSNLPVSNQVRT